MLFLACAIHTGKRYRDYCDYDEDCWTSSGSSGSSGASSSSSSSGGSSSGSSGSTRDGGRDADAARDALSDAPSDVADARPDVVDAAPDRDPCDGVVCSAPNGSAACVAGKCVITACDPGYGDCDSDASNGCEPLSPFYPDKDGDGHAVDGAPMLACTAPAGYAANKDDCDDDDARAYPGQVNSYGTPRPNGSFDFNCDGQESLLYTRIDPQYCLCNAGVCSISRGWRSEVPGCGGSAQFALDPVTPDACDIRYVDQTQLCQ